MKIDPITSDDPSNHDLLKMIVQVHECVEDGKRVTKQAVARVAVKAEAARKEAAAGRADVRSIQTALGLTDGKKKVAGLSTPWKAFIRSAGATATAMGGLLLLYRFAVSVAPYAWTFLVNLNHAILSGRF
jgi:hypothetical protein